MSAVFGFFSASLHIALKLILLWLKVELGSELCLLEGAANSPLTAVAVREGFGVGENRAGF